MEEKRDIFYFAKKGDLKKVKELVTTNKIDINHPDLHDPQDSYTPLIWASKNGCIDVVNYFISSGLLKESGLNQKGGWNGSTALVKAAENDKIDVVQALMNGGANLDLQNEFKSTAVMVAAEKGYKNIVTLLASTAKKDLQNEDGYTALILAAENGHENIVRILCEQGADKEIKNKFGKTALIMAAEFNRIECLKILIEKKANVNHTSKRGKTALMLAAVKGNKEIVELLLECLPVVDEKSMDSTTALALSFVPEDDKANDIAELLIVHGADKYSCDENGVTILMKAAKCGRLSIIKKYFANKDMKRQYNQQSKDGSTAMHYAASRGHIDVLIYLVDHGGDIGLHNQSGQTALNVLTNYYVNNNNDVFKKFVETTSRRQKHLQMMSDILPEFKSPNSILNSYFHKILYGVRKNTKDVEIVTSLVHIAVGIKKAYEQHDLEKHDLKERLASVNKMLVECMLSDALDIDDNVVRVFQDNQMRYLEDQREDVITVRDARGFMEGPLSLCIQHELLAILGTRQVTIHVDKVFYSSLRQNCSRPIYGFRDILQMRSNFVNFRSCPAANFYLDGVSRLVTFLLVGVVVVNFYISDDDGHSGATYNGRVTEYFLIVMIFATVLHEIGELLDTEWKLIWYLELIGYFKDIWNCLDIAAVVLLLAWLGLSFRGGRQQDFFPYSSHVYNTSTGINGNISSNSTSSTVIVFQHADAIACLATSAVPMSIGLLQYISTQQDLGQLVLTVFGMGADLGKFFVVFMVSVAGFGIAFHGMFAYTPSADDTRNFHTVEGTVYTLFDAALGQHDFGLFANDDYHIWGAVLFFSYIIMTLVILLNLVIATFSATYNKMNEQAVNRWCLMKARLVQTYLLIEERSPLAMLPAPLNLVPTMVYYFIIFITTFMRMPDELLKYFRHLGEPNSGVYENKNEILQRKKYRTLSLCGTVSDKLLSLVLLIPFTCYEIFLCLRDINKQAALPRTFYCFLAFTIFLFPLVFITFTIILFLEILKVKSILEIDENGHAELKHHITKKEMEKTTEEIYFEDAYIKLNIKIIRAELNNLSKYSYFSKPDLYARIKITNQLLITKPVTSEVTPLWNETKDFLIEFSEDDRNIEISIRDQYDGRIMGTYKDSIKPWIANGRFEGDVNLTDQNSTDVGKASIVVKVSVINPKEVGTAANDDIHLQIPTSNTSAKDNGHANHSETPPFTVAAKRSSISSYSFNNRSTKAIPGSPSLAATNIPEATASPQMNSHQSPETEIFNPGKRSILCNFLLGMKKHCKIYSSDLNNNTRTNITTTGKAMSPNTVITTQFNKRDQNYKDKEIFTPADRERIFHGVGDEKGNSYFRKNPFAYEIHTEIKQLLSGEMKTLLDIQAESKQLLSGEMKTLLDIQAESKQLLSGEMKTLLDIQTEMKQLFSVGMKTLLDTQAETKQLLGGEMKTLLSDDEIKE